MERKKTFQVLAFAIIFGFSSCIPMGDVSIDITGTVRDPKGTPLEGVLITVVDSDGSSSYMGKANSKSDGSYSIHMNSAPVEFKLKLTATKDGYKNYEKEMPNSEAVELKRFDIVLEPIPR